MITSLILSTAAMSALIGAGASALYFCSRNKQLRSALNEAVAVSGERYRIIQELSPAVLAQHITQLRNKWEA